MTAAGTGIVDLAVALPDGRLTVEEMHKTSGVSVGEILEVTHAPAIPVLAPGEQAWELAVDAAATVLDRTGTDPDSIGRVIYAGAGYWDAPAWSPAAKVADELGVTRAHCFEVTNFCNAFTLGIQLAVDGITDRPALVVAAERFGGAVDRYDPDSKALFNFGDAAAAALVRAGGAPFVHLGSRARTDPAWCDYFIGDWHTDGVHTRRRGHRRGLADTYVANLSALVRELLAGVGRDLADVRYLLVNQNDARIQERLLAAFDLPMTRTVVNHGEYGHLGSVDTLLALRQVWDAGTLAAGDVVLLATSGAGFSWSVTALEFRP